MYHREQFSQPRPLEIALSVVFNRFREIKTDTLAFEVGAFAPVCV